MISVEEIDFAKSGGLVPAIIQDAQTRKVLMLGYMNPAALKKTQESKKVTFWSRSKERLWTKGEESGNYLHLIKIEKDCDDDTLLIQVEPVGPVCHTGSDTCWGESNQAAGGDFLNQLQDIVESRKGGSPDSSYTASLLARGTAKVAQKVGEEAVETIIEAMRGDKRLLKEESADLLYHLLVLFTDQGISLSEVVSILESRHMKKNK